MTANEGKNYLRACLTKIAPSRDFDNLLCYKYANRKRAEYYQKDEICSYLTRQNRKDLKTGIPFIVTCFIHLEIYAAWHRNVGIGSGKYPVYKRDLINFEKDHTCDYMESIIGKTTDAKVYIFRNEI